MSTITSDRHNGNSGNCWCHTLDWGIRANSALRPQLKGFSTLCARDFSCAVSGFGQVLKSDLREKLFLAASLLVSSAEGRRFVGLRPTKLLLTREKKSLVPRVRFRIQRCGKC